MKGKNSNINDEFSRHYEKLPINGEELLTLKEANNVRIDTIHVKVDDINELMLKIVEILWDMSWMNEMLTEADAGISEMRAKATQNNIIPKIKECIDDSSSMISTTFKEYAISICSQGALRKIKRCKIYPLSELLKEKTTNNGGFDYIVLTPDENFVFGESKYRTDGGAHLAASKQVIEFIRNNKHISDCEVLQKFDKNAYKKCKKINKFDVSIGFSLSRMRLDKCINKVSETFNESDVLKGHTVYSIIIENDGIF